MRFAITADHREFFTKHHFIEFEQLFSLHDIETLHIQAENTIAMRLGTTVKQLKHRTASEVYQAAYDLWRDNKAIKKITHKHSLATLAADLLQVTPLRYGFDQYFTLTKEAVFPYHAPSSLQDISCLSPLAGALLVPLQDLPASLSFFPMPLKRGHTLFISPTFLLPWPQLFSSSGVCFLLIVFAHEKTRFCAYSHDPYAASLKKLGYVFNEILNDKLHPILYRI